MNDTYKIRKVGGALVVTIPQQIAKTAPLQAGDEVRFYLSGTGDVIIKRNGRRKPKGSDDYNLHTT